MTTGRRNFLLGALTGVSAAGAAAAGERFLRRDAGTPAGGKAEQTPEQTFGKASFAQQGEDLVLEGMLGVLKVDRPNYIDIGAGHPIIGNNTYKLYRKGLRGVLVEPNPALAEVLREVRPEDTVLELGIGVTDEAEADFYVFKKYGQLNTFSKEQADRIIARFGKDVLARVIKRRLVNINQVLAEHFKGRGPDLFSIDIEGLDEQVLRTLDFATHRPGLFCVETMELSTGRLEDDIVSLMQSKGYQPRGGSFVNTIFIDAARLPERAGAALNVP